MSKERKYIREFKGEDLDTIWHYDLDIARSPIKVEIKYHKTPKQFEQEAKAFKQNKKHQKSQDVFFKNKKGKV